MVNKMKNFIRKRLHEEIRASEAYRDMDAIQTLIDKKRNIAFIGQMDTEKRNFIINNGLLMIKVPENPQNCYVVYRQGAAVEAKELLKIANKYGGYLSYEATDTEIRRIGQLLSYNRADVEDYIQRNRPSKISEENIDGMNMNQGTQTACNTMSVATYKEGLKLIVNAIGTPQENPQEWKRIEKPLNNWQQEDALIGNEIKEKGMSGDSMVDESNTWWTAIQSTICEQGSDFV